MHLFKRGKTYYYEFKFKEKRYRASTHTRNERRALAIATEARARVIRIDAGLEPAPELKKAHAPTLREFQKTFNNWISLTKDAGKRQLTIKFYTINYQKLLDFKKFADTPLDQIDEALIEEFKRWALLKGGRHKLSGESAPVGKSTVNRYLATLRKALRYACFKLKLFDKVPVIEQYTKDEGTDREREYVFSPEEYARWVSGANEPLHSASILARNCGTCRGEMLQLQKDCVVLLDVADENGTYGDLVIKRGLKRRARRRILKINLEMKIVLQQLTNKSTCEYVLPAGTILDAP